jgi:AraC-like DNA-binding protein
MSWAAGLSMTSLDKSDTLIRNPDLLRRGEPFVQALRTIRLTGLEELLHRELGDIKTIEEKWKALFASPFLHHVAKGETAAIGMTALRMFFDQNFSSAVLDGLPALIHLEGFVPRNQSFVEAMLAQIIEQGEQGLSGQDTATRLAEALLVRCLSEFLVTFGEGRPGFLRGLKDPFLAKVIGAIQNQPDAKWTLKQMSRSAGLSRSGFAERFRITMGMTPVQFLTAVRMARATDLLVNGKTSIARIADVTGYGSEAAFNRAFRKWSGSPPGALRRSGLPSTDALGRSII